MKMVTGQAHFASWEPRFSKNCRKYPWHLYVKLGGVLRRFGYTAVALNGCLESEIQVHTKISTNSSVFMPNPKKCSKTVQLANKRIMILNSIPFFFHCNSRGNCDIILLLDYICCRLLDLFAHYSEIHAPELPEKCQRPF